MGTPTDCRCAPGICPHSVERSAAFGDSQPAPAQFTQDLANPHQLPAPPSPQSLRVTMITAGMLTGKARTEYGFVIAPGIPTAGRSPLLPTARKVA